MNIMAIDIGNSTITTGLFVKDEEKFIETIPGDAEDARSRLTDLLTSAWEQIPFVKSAKVKKRDGAIVVSSVKDTWTELVADICQKELDEKIKVIGVDIH